MKNLGGMSAKEALRFAKEQSGLKEKEIADELKLSLSVIKRYFNLTDPYLPSLEMIGRLNKVFHSDTLTRWLDAQYEKEEVLCREEITLRLTRLGSAFVVLCRLVGEEDFSPSAPAFHETVVKMISELRAIQNLSARQLSL